VSERASEKEKKKKEENVPVSQQKTNKNILIRSTRTQVRRVSERVSEQEKERKREREREQSKLY